MRRAVFIFAGLLVTAGCSRGLSERYPSYDLAVARLEGGAVPTGVRIADGDLPPGSYCDCPRVFYHGYWVYSYSGRWIYWETDSWYTFPGLYVYYLDGVPFVYDGPTRSIRKGQPQRTDQPSPARAQASDDFHDRRLRVRPERPIREPARPTFKPVDARPSPKRDR